MGVTATREGRLATLRQILRNNGTGVLVVAELGSWKGQQGYLRGITVARDAGADVVKIQVFRALHFPSEEWDTKAPLEWRRRYLNDFVAYANTSELLTSASVFDLPAVVQCSSSGIDILKLAAREQGQDALREHCLNSDVPVFRSIYPGSNHGTHPRELILGCISVYPTDNGVAMAGAETMADVEEGPWGWSSHTRDWADCVEAVRLGARVIEKHLALTEDDIEAEWSLMPKEFAEMVSDIREAESGIKR